MTISRMLEHEKTTYFSRDDRKAAFISVHYVLVCICHPDFIPLIKRTEYVFFCFFQSLAL